MQLLPPYACFAKQWHSLSRQIGGILTSIAVGRMADRTADAR